MNAGLPHETAIQTPDQRLRVFVSSTLGELAEERRAVSRAISALRLTPVLFELGARPHPPRDVYRAYLAQSDIFIGLYWQRYGERAPGTDMSGLEEEFELSQGLPRLLYVKSPAPDREPRLASLLERMKGEASYRAFRTPAELSRLVRDDLATLLSERFMAGPQAAAAPLPSSHILGRPLPAEGTSLIGRDLAINEVTDLLMLPDVRLVTLTGPGGIGKTRLAEAVGERVGDRFDAGTGFVPLAMISDPAAALVAISRALGADLLGTGAPLQFLAEQLGDDAWLLILDNLEQVAGAAPDLAELLVLCPRVVILATSRTVLGLRAEREYPVPPLPLPADPATIPADMLLSELAASPAVALFTDRARALRPDFAVTVRNAAAVAEICRRLEGLPLAIELAAARTRLLDPAALLERLEASLDALGTGTVDMPERQRTLRATVEWSVGLLSDAERSLLEAAAIFVDSWTVEAAAGVAADTQERALELAEALVRHSLLYTENVGDGPRLRMLDTVREFVSERLAARPDVAQIERRHAHYYRELAEQAGRPLRTAEQSQWLRRLQPEVGNLGVAVRWYLTHDRMQLPHMFRLLLPFVVQADDILADALSWIDQLLPDADAMDLQAQAELLLPAVLIKNQTGDGAGALADGQRLEALLTELDDPYLHAASLLVVAWTLPISGDLDAGISKALAALEEFRPLDEPYWMTAGLLSTGYMEREAGRYDDAERHLRNSHEMAVRFDYSWMAAGSQLQLGSLAVEQGHMEQARTLLDESLAASLARYSTPNVILGLAAYARLAFAGGDPERAALLAGASEGLRKRAGLGIWADPQRGEADFAAQIRGAIGADRFDRAFTAGFRLNRRDAVAAARGRPAAASDESGG